MDPTAESPGGAGPAPRDARGAGATARVLALFDGHRLSPTQRRIAQYLLDHLPDAAFLTSVALARRVGVSQPSVTRFAVALGFEGFPGLREALRPIVLSSMAAGDVGTPEQIRRDEAEAAVDDERRNLAVLGRYVAESSRLAEVGAALAGSVPLVVLGTRVSESLARYFGYAAQRIHPDVRLLTHGGTASLDTLSQARAAGGTWVLGFVMPRYAAESVAALRAARTMGLRVAAVTDVPLVPFDDAVDVVLPAGGGSRLVFDSYAAPMVLAALLLQAMADAAPERTQAFLESHERLSERHRFYEG